MTCKKCKKKFEPSIMLNDGYCAKCEIKRYERKDTAQYIHGSPKQ